MTHFIKSITRQGSHYFPRTFVGWFLRLATLCYSVLLVGNASADVFVKQIPSAQGTVPVLIIMADFSDQEFSLTQNEVWAEELVFGEQRANITSVFREYSNNRFTFEFGEVVGPVRYTDPKQPDTLDDERRVCAFNNKDASGALLCPGSISNDRIARARILEIAVENGFDFSQYDKNADGKVVLNNLDADDALPIELAVLWIEGSAGGGGAYRAIKADDGTECLWIEPQQINVCGTVGGIGDMANEYVVVHEISHALGTIDLYRGNGGNNSSLMASRLVHLDPWHKMQLGWVDPFVIEHNEGQKDQIVSLTGQPIVLQSKDWKGSEEYFIIEFRSNHKSLARQFDAGIRINAGVFLWQVDNSAKGGTSHHPKNFGHKYGGWRAANHKRVLADINGDGRKDIVGFGGQSVLVAFSQPNPALKRPQFVPLMDLSSDFVNGHRFPDKLGSWSFDRDERFVADVNGDRREDLIGFTDDNVYVSLANGRLGFSQIQNWSTNFVTTRSWDHDEHLRLFGDVNGDGFSDIVRFHDSEVFVELSDPQNSKFSDPVVWLDGNLTKKAGGWNKSRHVRVLADVNGDSMLDIVAFGERNVFVSLSNGTSFVEPSVWLAEQRTQDYGGWRVESHLRTVADVDGDGFADLVGFWEKDVLVSIADPTESKFLLPEVWLKGQLSYEQGWDADENPRILGDVNGDGADDIVAFANDGVDVRLSLPSNRRFQKSHTGRKVNALGPGAAGTDINGNAAALIAHPTSLNQIGQTMMLRWANGRTAYLIELLDIDASSGQAKVRIKPLEPKP